MTNCSLASALLNSRQTFRYLNFNVLHTDKLSRFYFGSELFLCHHMELVCLSHNHLKKTQNDPLSFLSEPGSNDSIWHSFPTFLPWLLLHGCLCFNHLHLPCCQKGWAPSTKRDIRACLFVLSLNNTGGISDENKEYFSGQCTYIEGSPYWDF